MSVMKKFTAHPATVGETYGQHFVSSMSFSLGLLRAAFVCAVHAVFPWAFEKTGSACITDLHSRMVANRNRLAEDRNSELETHGA